MKKILVDGIRNTDKHSLASPVLLSARLFQKGTNVVIAADWICDKPVGDGLILKFRDGSERRTDFDRCYVEANRGEAVSGILFGGAVGTRTHPELWETFIRDDIVSVVLTTNGCPVSNAMDVHVVKRIAEDGQPTVGGDGKPAPQP